MSRKPHARRTVGAVTSFRTASLGLATVKPPNSTAATDKSFSTFQLENSTVVVEPTPAGYIGRIEHDTDWSGPNPEYTAPLSKAMLNRLSEVAR
jgi:hypothetical protein